MAGHRGIAEDLRGRLSLKVAELTMVVHLLFTRSHEREVEIETLKKHHEQEVNEVKKEFKDKIAWLEKQLHEYERIKTIFDLNKSESDKDKEKLRKVLERQNTMDSLLSQKDQRLEDAMRKIGILEIRLKDYESMEEEFSNVRMLLEEKGGRLDKANSTIDDMTGKIKELEKLCDEFKTLKDECDQYKRDKYSLQVLLKSKGEEMNGYKHHIQELERSIAFLEEDLSDANNENEKLQKKLQSMKGTSNEELAVLKKTIVDLTRSQEKSQERIQKLLNDNNKLDAELKNVEKEKREAQIKIRQLLEELRMSKETQKMRRKELKDVCPPVVPRKFLERDDEIEQLRREVQRYKMELLNREDNFNRVFADHQPVTVNANETKKLQQYLPELPYNLTGTPRRRSHTMVQQAHFPTLDTEPRLQHARTFVMENRRSKDIRH